MAKMVCTQEEADEFCGCLIAIDCEDDSYLQGEVLGVDPLQRTITLGRPLKDGCPMGVESFFVLPSTVRELKILKMPPKKDLNSCDESRKKLAKKSSPAKIQEGPSIGTGEGDSSLKRASLRKSTSTDQPSCSFDSKKDGVSERATKLMSENQVGNSPVLGKRIDVSDLLKPSLQPKNREDGHRHSESRGKNYVKYGELFNNQQVVASCVLQVNKSRSAQEPGGMPLIDCSNECSCYRGATDVELKDPTDFKELKNDSNFGTNPVTSSKQEPNVTNEFCGCLVAIDCEDDSYLQGEVFGVDPVQRTITLGRPLKDGCPMGLESFVVVPNAIRELKILKMPPKKDLNSRDESRKKLTKKSSPAKIQKGPSIGSGKGDSSLTRASFKKNASTDQPSCSFENKKDGVNGRVTKFTSENQVGNSPVLGKRIDVSDLLNPFLQPKNRGNGHRQAEIKGNSYIKYGEYKLFNNQQVAAPRVLQVNKSRSAQEPSGMPLIDCSNGYSGYRGGTAVELADPIDFNELKNDFDFGANLLLFDKESLADGSPEDAKDGKTLISTKNFRNDQNILSDPKRIISWTKAVESEETAGEYVGRLITISCGELGSYQGKVVSVDTENQTITIDRPFKDGMPLTDKTLTLLGSDMRGLKVHEISAVSKDKTC